MSQPGHRKKHLATISPSQIKAWRNCPRKWAWDKLEGIRGKGSPSTGLGTRVHEIAEAYLLEGKPPDLEETFTYPNPRRPEKTITRYPGRIFNAGIHHNPSRHTPGLTVEGAAEFRTPAGGWYGRIDLHWPGEDGIPTVQDHKTTSSLSWAMSEEDLQSDPQALIYAAWCRLHYGSRYVRLRWVYYETKPRSGGGHRSRKVETILDTEDPAVVAYRAQ